jgi:ADP-heptose:LPS heptosyltransferase
MTDESLPLSAQQLVNAARTDCLHYRGDRPCVPHTRSGARCTCSELITVRRRGVIIKLGAAGDVLRTTPLLRAIDPMVNGVHVLWITDHPELLPADVCEPVKFEAATLARLMATEWDFCWNLDKDVRACAIAAQVCTKERAGYSLVNGAPFPVDERAWHKFATGLDDPYSKANHLNYVQEIFNIVGLSYSGEEYWLRSPDESSFKTAEAILPGDGWIGLNTGAGFRWPTRIWPETHWAGLIETVKENGLRPVILGGPDEERMNERLASRTGSLWPGVQTLDVFYALIHRCRCLVTSVTQAMHLAIGAKTPLILFNNIFNPSEFELYGRGEIVAPKKPCDCYYDAVCRTRRDCIKEITVEQVVAAVLRTVQ